MDSWGRFDDREVLSALQRLRALGLNPRPALQEIAALGETSTRLRFRTQISPDGIAWKKSERVKDKGGRTLTMDGHLADSTSSNAGKDFAEWGVNRTYAATHQFGAVIKPKKARYLSIPLTTKARLEGSPRNYPNKLFFLETKEGKFLIDAETGKAQYMLVSKVTIPARPFLGVSEEDRGDFINTLQRRIDGAIHAR